MAKLADYPVLNFSGGIRRDKSMFEMQKNELIDARNVEIDEGGRVRVRRGTQQIGDTQSGNIENSFVFYRQVGDNLPVASFLINNTATTGVIWRVNMIRLSTAITSGATTLTTTSTTAFASSGNASINGDQFAYTGTTATSLTGVTGIVRSHAAGSCIVQTKALSTSGTLNFALGAHYAVAGNGTTANNTLYIAGFGAIWNQIDNNDGETLTAVTGEPSAIMLTNFRDRLYGAGDGGSGTNGNASRVSYSALGNGGSWTTASDFFDVGDQRGEPITGFKVFKDTLWIPKFNSFFSYDQVELKQRQFHVGAWNHKVIQEIGGVLYTFCPNGIFATNGFESVDIGEPVREFWQNFAPVFDSGPIGRMVMNTFSAKTKDKYILYIQDITSPTSTNDVTLVYDTFKKSWSVFEGLTNFQHLNFFEKYPFGDTRLNLVPSLFGGNDSGQFYKLFSNKYRDNAATPTIQGGDLLFELEGNSQNSVSGYFETPLYDLTRPDLYKQFNKVRFFVEQGQWNIEYRTHKEGGVSGYKSLGVVSRDNAVLPFPTEANGWRVGFRISSNTVGSIPIFNGFVIKDTEVSRRT